MVCVDDLIFTQVNTGFKACSKILFESFCAAWIANSGSEKAFDGFYFTIPESIIFSVAYDLVISCSDIVDGKRTTVLRDNFRKLDLFDKLGSPPAFLFVIRQGDMV